MTGGPQNIDEAMLSILAIDPAAALRFSIYTRSWYVASSVEIGDGSLLRGVAEHCVTPLAAVQTFHHRLTEVQDADHYIAARPHGQRRNYRWNGVAFAEAPMPATVQS